jgi:hypothetical protein
MMRRAMPATPKIDASRRSRHMETGEPAIS